MRQGLFGNVLEPAIFLLDLDGVLVQPGGYRAAVRAAINYFCEQMGLGALAPDDQTLAIYEAQGITCEWDMVPITLAIVLDRVLEQFETYPVFDNLPAASGWLKAQRVNAFTLDFAPILRGLGRYQRVGEAPADTLYQLCLDGMGRELFPRLCDHGVLRDLLTHSRRPARSRTTHVFETFVLGDAAFSKSLQLAAEVCSESYLARYDRPLLLPETRSRLLELWRAQRLRLVAYTARPSAPLHETDEPMVMYVPEAEMALELVGLNDIPLVGSGQMGEAALRLGENEDRLTKPAPYHALAAVATAWTGERRAGLDWALSAFRHFESGGERPSLDVFPSRLQLHVFEDSPSGMTGGKLAAEMLCSLGISTEVHLWGVTAHPDKIQALESLGAVVSADINQAVALALG